MDLAEIVLEYIKVFIWPVTVVLVVLLFKKQLQEILERIRKADLPGGFSLDFQQEVR